MPTRSIMRSSRHSGSSIPTSRFLASSRCWTISGTSTWTSPTGAATGILLTSDRCSLAEGEASIRRSPLLARPARLSSACLLARSEPQWTWWPHPNSVLVGRLKSPARGRNFSGTTDGSGADFRAHAGHGRRSRRGGKLKLLPVLGLRIHDLDVELANDLPVPEVVDRVRKEAPAVGELAADGAGRAVRSHDGILGAKLDAGLRGARDRRADVVGTGPPG